MLDSDAANLFHTFPTYTRGAMTIEGYRQIVGERALLRLREALQSKYRL